VKENNTFIYGEKAILDEAEYHNQCPKQSTCAAARPPSEDWGMPGPWGPQATGLRPAAIGP
jgi:hypothetical protein